jgi:hypothetical protein
VPRFFTPRVRSRDPIRELPARLACCGVLSARRISILHLRKTCIAVVWLLGITVLPLVQAGDHSTLVTGQPAFAALHIPRLEHGPSLADFLEMQPSPAFAGKMLKVEGFVQRDPKDGAPASQKTEVYLGYTDKNLYVICVCFDAEPNKIRARMGRREAINDDDQFGFVLDTFHDKKHGLFFYLNPLGIQQDGIWTDNQEPDYSYDMVWRSDAKLTAAGYVVWFEIPFRSLRFPARSDQNWGLFFERDIRRNNEFSFYPHITSNAQGFLAQETEMDGLEKISPGRNMQFIPYLSVRSFRSLDDRDPNNPHFHGKHIEPRPGLDSKIVLKDALVLDATINPDFSQVESDQPQITVNQRFEVFFPEKRPFFLENAAYFDTPINLVFTRRIADPEYGIRLTGKLGPWSLGTLFADDKSPGLSVAPYDPLAGHKAYFGILRVNRDIGKESTLGLIYTDRELDTVPGEAECTDNPCVVSSNRVGGLDTKIKFNSKWMATAQALTSHTTLNDGTEKGGPAYDVFVERSSRNLEYNVLYQDTSANFETDTGFFRRPDVRRFSQFALYRFRREGKILQWHGPSLFTINNWDHTGTRLEWFANTNYRWIFQGQTDFGFYGNLGHERLRPVDFDTLTANRDYAHYHAGLFFDFGYFKPLSLGGEMNFGTDTNFDPAVGPPVLAKSDFAAIFATVRPVNGLTIENTYLLTRLRDLDSSAGIFNNHIIRSKWNYQFTRAFSLRVIGQYSTVLANPARTSLQTTKNLNADVLLTYLVHPGTAVYLGYNSNLENLDPSLALDPNGNLLRGNRFINDGRQFFVKISYLFQY